MHRLNLAMPPELVAELIKRGRTAGEKLRADFDFKQHVWTRYRTTMSTLAQYLEKLCDDYRHPANEAEDIWEIITGVSKREPACYAWESEKQRDFAVVATSAIAKVGCEWSKDRQFEASAPRPEPELSARPKF